MMISENSIYAYVPKYIFIYVLYTSLEQIKIYICICLKLLLMIQKFIKVFIIKYLRLKIKFQTNSNYRIHTYIRTYIRMYILYLKKEILTDTSVQRGRNEASSKR